MSQTNWEADKMLDVYIHDYLVKRDLKATAQAFQAEGKVSSDPVAIDAPGGFLFEWWSVFWDIFIARTNEKHSEVAASYIETQLLKAREQQQQQPQPQSPQTQHQLQMQQLLLQRQQQQQQQQQQHQQQQQQQHQQQQQQQHQQQQQQQHQQQQQQQHQQQQQQQHQQPQQQHQQPQQQQTQQQQHQQPSPQQRRDGSHLSNGNANGIGGSDPLVRQNPGTANAIAKKMYEESQRDSLDEKATKRLGENVGLILDPNHASILKSAAGGGLPSGQVLHGTAGGMSPQVQHRNQQLSGAAPTTQDIKPDISPPLNPRGPPEGSLLGMAGSNDGGNNLTLKGWPLTGWENIRGGLLQPQKSFMQSPQPFPQFHMLPQHQQQLLLAQQNLTSPSSSDENRRLRMLLNNRNIALNKDGFPNVVGGVVPNVGSSLGGGLLPRGETDMMIKLKIAEMHQQQQLQQQLQQNNNSQLLQQQQLPQHSPSNPQSQNSSHNVYQQDKMGGAGSVTMDGSMSNSFRGNDQVPKNQSGRKRKQPVSSSGPANSSGTANTGPSPSSTPSTPSTHAPGDVMSMPPLPHNGGSSKPLMIFGSDGTETLPSPSNHLAEMDQMVEDPSLDDNVESFLSHDEADQRDTVGRCMDAGKGFTFDEVNSVHASNSKISCCHFSSDGKLLATGGHDKKVVLWYTETLKQKNTLDEHVGLITDVRFSPSMPRLATSSFDKTVRVWDADNGFSLRNFAGHSASVMSLDFHPNKDDLICSCDGHGEIRYWSVNNGNCMRVFKGGTSQVRFQPRHGRYLAAAAESFVSILDVETQTCTQTLQGTKPIHSVCWDTSGELLASVSEDSVRVWRVGSGSELDCLHELNCSGNKVHSCVFHPSHPSLLVIGCYQSLELWNIAENKNMTLSAHEGLISALAASPVTGLVASASHDKTVKLWK